MARRRGPQPPLPPPSLADIVFLVCLIWLPILAMLAAYCLFRTP